MFSSEDFLKWEHFEKRMPIQHLGYFFNLETKLNHKLILTPLTSWNKFHSCLLFVLSGFKLHKINGIDCEFALNIACKIKLNNKWSETIFFLNVSINTKYSKCQHRSNHFRNHFRKDTSLFPTKSFTFIPWSLTSGNSSLAQSYSWFVTMSTQWLPLWRLQAENLKFCTFIRDWPASLFDYGIFGKSDEQLNCDKKGWYY